MTVIQSIVLGIIQGLTEFLPISSSGHLVLFQKLFGLSEGVLLFDVAVHLGTLVAVAAVFWQDIAAMLKKPFSKLTLLIIVGTIPTGLMGVLFKDFFEKLFKSGSTLGIEFILTGLVLWFAEKIRTRNRGLTEINYADAAFVGFMQGIAILPAVSRSGLTIAGSLFRGMERNFAARFSFLLSIPAILGAAAVEAKDLTGADLSSSHMLPVIIGTVFAAIFGYLAIKIMLRVLTRGNMRGFAYYVWALGAVVIIFQLLGKF